MSYNLDSLRAELLIAEAKVESLRGEAKSIVGEMWECVTDTLRVAFKLQEQSDYAAANGNLLASSALASLASVSRRESQRMARYIETAEVIS